MKTLLQGNPIAMKYLHKINIYIIYIKYLI